MGQLNGWGRQEEDGTWTAGVETTFSSGETLVLFKQTGLKTCAEAEEVARRETIAYAEEIGRMGGNPRKEFDCRDGGTRH